MSTPTPIPMYADDTPSAGALPDGAPATPASPAAPDEGRWLLLAGLLLGFAASHLLPLGLAGPGFTVWLGLLSLAALWFCRHRTRETFLAIGLWSVVALVASLLIWQRETPVLTLLLSVVILTAGTLALQQVRNPALAELRMPDLLFAGLSLPAQALAGTWPLLAKADLGGNIRHPALPGLLRGMILTLPLLLVFSFLFGSADRTFGRWLDTLGQALFPDSPLPLVLLLVFGWIGAGLLAGLATRPVCHTLPTWRHPTLGREETALLMGGLSALFLCFVILQARYLFGGAAIIESISGLTVAEHARRGFFELVCAAFLTLGLLLIIGACTTSRRLFRSLGLLLIACVLVMLASALQRLLLYVESFGLTLDRVVALAFLVWTGGNLLAFAGTALRERYRGFTLYFATSGIAIVLVLAIMNPAAQVARINIERAGSGAELDLQHLLNLGADAVPPLLGAWDTLSAEQQCIAAMRLLNDWRRDRLARQPDGSIRRITQPPPGAPVDWRDYNRSWHRAAKAVDAAEEVLRSVSDAARARLEAEMTREVLQGLRDPDSLPFLTFAALRRVDCSAPNE